MSVATADGEPIGAEVVVETTPSYFAAFDINDLQPAPDRTWQSEDATTWELDPNEETSLRLSLDLRTQPDARWNRSATTVVRVGDRDIARFDYRTTVLP